MPRRWSDHLKGWMLVPLVVLACLALGYSLLAPAPPRTLRIAVGPSPDSAYNVAAEAYAEKLRRVGFRVETRHTAGSVENLELLRAGQLDLALVQGGLADPARDAALDSLGAVFFEPLWLFVRRDAGLDRPADARGRRVAVGPEGSGTRALALALFEANGIAPTDLTLLPAAGDAAAEALENGSADAAIFVSARPGTAIHRLLRAPDVRLFDFAARADAYGARLPYLTSVTLPQGAVSLAEDLPPQSVTLLATVASVVAPEGLHPQIVSLMVGIMQEVHRDRSLFAPAGRFPSAEHFDFRINADALRYYERGPTFLQTWLPFWVAVSVERLWVLLIPLVGIALPALRLGPALYRWHWESRIWRHYDALRAVEAELNQATSDADRARALDALEAVDQQLMQMAVPMSYRRHIFSLRRDVAYVRAFSGTHRYGIADERGEPPAIGL